jgi:hypothetical protein
MRPITVGDRCEKCGIPLSDGVIYVTVKQRGRTVRRAESDVCIGCVGALVLDSPQFLRKLAELLVSNLEQEDPG